MRIGRVYKIIALEGNEVYVGSTFNTVRDRFKQHREDYRKYKKGNRVSKLSVYDIFDKYGKDGCKMVLIKEYECCDRSHLEAYEQLWINKIKPINKQNPFYIKFLSKRKYYYDNRDKVLEQKKKYGRENREKIAEQKKKYGKENKEKLAEQAKNYREKNKEKLAERKKIYYANSPLIKCGCGSEIKKCTLSKHKKTKKHQAYLSSQS